MPRFIAVICGLLVAFLAGGCGARREPPAVAYKSSYSYPLTSPGAQFGALPPPAQNAIRAEAGSAEITSIQTVTRGGVLAYRVTFRNRDLFPPLYVGADGTVLHANLEQAMGAPQDAFGMGTGSGASGVKLSELPPPVRKVLEQRAPRATISHINKQTWGDRIVYIVAFADPQNYPRLYLTADGTVLNEGPK